MRRTSNLFTLLSLSSVIAGGCATRGEAPDSTTPRSDDVQTLSDAGHDSTNANVEVDVTPPIALEEWRAVKQGGEAAIAFDDLDARIEACRAFVREHPRHQVTGEVLGSLADALVAKGGFRPDELTSCLEAKAELEDDSGAPLKIVQRYHLKRDLPLQSGLRLVEMSRDRVAEDERELTLETNERRREALELRAAYDRAQADLYEARLYLKAGKAALALEALDRGRGHTAKLATDVVVRDAKGKIVHTLPTGVLEELDILTAEAHHRKGDDEAARKALRDVIGFVDDLEVRAIYDELRAALRVDKGMGRSVTTQSAPAQAFELKDLSGKAVKLSDFRGKVVLVTFWATWCGPCKKELPELQRFGKAHADKGVEILAVNIDDFNSRSKIKPFLESNNLGDIRVLLEQPEQLTEYNYSGIPSLYVIDREGRIAHARTGYDPELEDKLEGEILELVEQKKASDRELLVIEQMPEGWDVLWKQPISGDVMALAVAEPTADAGGEVGAIGRDGLVRWSADGKELGAAPLSGWTRSLDAADLDGNGKREWIVGGWQDLKVLDHTGKLYWSHAGDGGVVVGGLHDLDADGFSEIVLQAGDRVIAMKAVPEPMWKSAPLKELESVNVDPSGAIAVQADGEVLEMSGRGEITGRAGEAPTGQELAGRIDGLHVFKGPWNEDPKLGQDIDGDGRSDVVVPAGRGVIVYDRDGKPVLRLRSPEASVTPAVGDLDGKPGAELVVFVEHYGLVALGKKN